MFNYRRFKQLLLLLRCTVAIGVILIICYFAAKSVFLPAPNDDLRTGDRLFARGAYYAATQIYQASWRTAPSARASLRIGMIETVRGEITSANRSFARALDQGLAGQEADVLRLYQGYVALRNGQRTEAFGLWRTIANQSPFSAYRQVLEAEALLDSGDYAGAEASYQAARTGVLQPAWQNLVVSRLAALRATSDPVAALALLQTMPAPALHEPHSLVLPLLPQPQPTNSQLAAALQAPADQRASLLGQLYLAAGWYGLAEAQFASGNAGAEAISSRAYAAYARLQAGDSAGAIARLEAIVAEHPQDTRPRTLLALAYLGQSSAASAQAQLAVVRQLAPQAAETHLAWGQWYAAQSDYTAAANEYRRALADAPAEQRGSYFLALAQFQLDATLRVCEDGLPAAEQAARLLDSAAAWTTLAKARLSCNDYAGASSAAAQALDRDGANAEAAFYHGQALALLGQRAAARDALIATADLAPASDWRIKAERSLAAFGLR